MIPGSTPLAVLAPFLAAVLVAAAPTPAQSDAPVTAGAPADVEAIGDAFVQLSDVPKAGRDSFTVRGRIEVGAGSNPVADGVAHGVRVAVLQTLPPTPSIPCPTDTEVEAKDFAPEDCKAIFGGRSLYCRDASDNSVFHLRRSSSPTRFRVNSIVRGLDLSPGKPWSLPLVGDVWMRGARWRGTTERGLCRVTQNGERTACRSKGTLPPTPPCSSPPIGPVVYEKVAGVFAETNAASSTARAVAGGQGASGGCGAVMSDAGAGVTVASGFLSFIPVAGPALGAVATAGGSVLGLFGASNGNTCVENQIANINQQLSDQQSQITDIENQLNLLSNAFYAAYYQLAAQVSDLSQLNFQQALQTFTGDEGGTGGLFPTFMEDVGLWQLDLSPVANASLQNPTQTLVTNASPDEAGQSQFRNALQSLSGTAYDTSCSSNCYSTVGSILSEPNCLPSSGCSSLIAAYQTLSANLGGTISSCTAADSSACPTQPPNAVPSFDQYNVTVVSMYQQAVYALQQAFTIEYATNQINYYYGIANPTAPVPPGVSQNTWGGVPGTFYAPSGGTFDVDSETSAYNDAQEQLALMYAARVNALYANTLYYVFTDVPIGGQSWPVEAATITVGGSPVQVPNPIQYSSQVGLYLTPSVPLDLVQLGGTTWQPYTALYQYAGLQDVNSCISAIENFNATASVPGLVTTALAGNACPSILALPGCSEPAPTPTPGPSPSPNPNPSPACALDQSTLNATTMNPYTSYPTSPGPTPTPGPGPTPSPAPIALAGYQAGNLTVCGPTGNAAWYVPAPAFLGNAAQLQAGQAYLWCDDVVVATAPDSSSYSPPSSGGQLDMGGTGNNASYPTEDGAYKYLGAVVNDYVPNGATQNSSGVYNVGQSTPEGWGFDAVKDGPSYALSTQAVTLQGTGQGVTLPYGLFMTDIGGSAILSINAPANASIATTGYVCSPGNPGVLECTFFDGTTLDIVVTSQAQIYGQSGWGVFSVNCPIGGC